MTYHRRSQKAWDQLRGEAAQWQESCGQNYVRATEAEMREEELRAETERLKSLIERLYDLGHIVDIHEADCPTDDTCRCEFANLVNEALKENP